MTMAVKTAHRVAAALAVIFLVLAILTGSRYYQAHNGWDIESGNSELMAIMFLVLGFVLAGSFAVLQPSARNTIAQRQTSVVWSLALFVCLFFTWHVIISAHRWEDLVGTAVTSPQELETYTAEHPDSFAPYIYRVPTGVFLQSFEFLNANNVEMAGYIWQTYGPEVPETVKRGFSLPEAVEESYDAQEVWRIPQPDGGEKIGWYFFGKFRQIFNYRLYPFDRQAIWLRIWPLEPTEAVLLVPDFAAYRDLTPSTLPGIDTQFVYGGWDPLGSEFSLDLIDYNVNFGLGSTFNDVPQPDLYFNISVERDFLGPILEHVVLEAAIAILLFFLLVLMASESEVQERTGLTIFDLIVAAGGLLFAVILDHSSIRNSVASQELSYLEWFPLLLSVFIVLVVLSAVLRVQGWRVPGIGYTGDLMPVYAYWPALIGSILAITLIMFFVQDKPILVPQIFFMGGT
jgi:hypothetical protein